MLKRLHLEIIRAVSEQGSMTSAARALNLTQSALSHSMRKLEEQLNLKLWDRVGRKLEPTQAGRHLLTAANRILPQFVGLEERLKQFALGERGTLRIGMECHPCYQWLQKIIPTYLSAWPLVDLDVRQKFQFGGIGALFADEIDLLVTPDPLRKKGLNYTSVFNYEQVLVVGDNHPLRNESHIIPRQLGDEILFTYPVSQNRLDIYTHFLMPKGMTVRRQKVVETTEIMLQMVACGRGVAALPRWLVEKYSQVYPVHGIRLGVSGIQKQIYFGIRQADAEIDYLKAFIELALNG